MRPLRELPLLRPEGIVSRVAEMMRQLPLQGRLESTLAYRLEQAPLPEYVPRVPFEVL